MLARPIAATACGMWHVRAENRAGENVKLQIDANSGRVIGIDSHHAGGNRAGISDCSRDEQVAAWSWLGGLEPQSATGAQIASRPKSLLRREVSAQETGFWGPCPANNLGQKKAGARPAFRYITCDRLSWRRARHETPSRRSSSAMHSNAPGRCPACRALADRGPCR